MKLMATFALVCFGMRGDKLCCHLEDSHACDMIISLICISLYCLQRQPASVYANEI